MRQFRRFYIQWGAVLLLVGLGLAGFCRPSQTTAGALPTFPPPTAGLPGFPTPTPAAPLPVTPTALPPALYGTSFTLHIRGEARDMVDWLWFTRPWYELITIVQWQDGEGKWHNVDGWRGAPDAVVNNEGLKTWWVPDTYFGAGPFRWVVYDRQETRTLGVSDPFTMPTRANTMLHVDVTILQSSMK